MSLGILLLGISWSVTTTTLHPGGLASFVIHSVDWLNAVTTIQLLYAGLSCAVELRVCFRIAAGKRGRITEIVNIRQSCELPCNIRSLVQSLHYRRFIYLLQQGLQDLRPFLNPELQRHCSCRSWK